MLETADLSRKLTLEAYKRLLPGLQNRLRHLQNLVREAHIPVVIVIEGWDLTGKGAVIRLLSERLDLRGFRSYPIYPSEDQEKLFPFLRRFWLRLPARGEMVLFYHSWYGRLLGDRVEKRCKTREWKEAYQQINEFERQLTDEGAVVIKYWFHTSRKDQRKRLKKYAKDPFEKWQVTPEVRKRVKKYDRYLVAAEEMLERTNSTQTPWLVVEAKDSRYARIKVFQSLIESLECALQKSSRSRVRKLREIKIPADATTQLLEQMPTLLDQVDLKKKLSRKEYDQQLNEAQLRLRELQFEIAEKKLPVMIVFEGWDAAGKGGNIHRLTEKLDPRWLDVFSIAAPSHEEKEHHYLWRFWKRLPSAGKIGIFDRSWYGRILVERIEGFCTQVQWQRAFQEIREFEHQLMLNNTTLVKLWLHISREEQLRRFKEREKLHYKRHKITEEDWRNREKWDDYHDAVVEMLNRTSTTYAPWTIVEGNCKWWARVKSIQTVIQAIETKL